MSKSVKDKTSQQEDPYSFRPEYNELVKVKTTPAPDKAEENAFAFKPEFNEQVKKKDVGAGPGSEYASILPEQVDVAAENYATRKLRGNDVSTLGQTDWGKTQNFNLLNGEEADAFARAHNSPKATDLAYGTQKLIDEFYPVSPSPEQNKTRNTIIQSVHSGDQESIINTKNAIINNLNTQIAEVYKANNRQTVEKEGFGAGMFKQMANYVPKEVQDQVDQLKAKIAQVGATFNQYGINQLVSKRENAEQVNLEVSPNKLKTLEESTALSIGAEIEKRYGLTNTNDNTRYERQRAGLAAIIENKQRTIADLQVQGYTQKNAAALAEADKQRRSLAQYKEEYDNLLEKYPDVGITQTAKVIGDDIAEYNPRLSVISKKDVQDAAKRIEARAPGFTQQYGKYVDVVAESEGEGMGSITSGLVPKGGLLGGIETGTKRAVYDVAGQVAEYITHNEGVKQAAKKGAAQTKLQGTSFSGEVPTKIVYDKDGNGYKEQENENYGKFNWNSATRFVGSAIPGLVEWVAAEEATGGLATVALASKAKKITDIAEATAALGKAQRIGKDVGLVGASLITGFDQNRHVADQLIEDPSSLGEAKKNSLAAFMSLTTAGVFKIAGYSPSSFVERALSKSVSEDALALLEKNGWKQPTSEETASFIKNSVLPRLKQVAKASGQAVGEGAKIGAATVSDEKIKEYVGTVINPDKVHPISAEEATKSFVEQTLFMSLLGMPRAIRGGISSPTMKDAYYEMGLRAPQYIDRINEKLSAGEYDPATANKAISVIKTMEEEVNKVQDDTNKDGTPMTLQQKRDIAIENFRKRASKQMRDDGETIDPLEVMNHANTAIEAIRSQNRNLALTDTHAFQTATAENGKKPENLQEIENHPDTKYKFENNDGKVIEGTGLQLLTEIQNSKAYVKPNEAKPGETTPAAEGENAQGETTQGDNAESQNTEAERVVSDALSKGVIKGVYADVAKENPTGFLKELSDQIHGITSTGEKATTGTSEKAAREQYGNDIVDAAIKLFPEETKTNQNESKTGERSTLQGNREEGSSIGGNEPGSSSSRSGNKEVRKSENGEAGGGRPEEKVAPTETTAKETIVNNKTQANESESKTRSQVGGEEVSGKGGNEGDQIRQEGRDEKGNVLKPVEKGEANRAVAEPSSFTTQSGKQKVVIEDGVARVRDAKTGKEVSKPTERKALREYADSIDYDKGEKAPEPPADAQFRNEQEAKDWTVENSKNPAELAAIYVDEEPATPKMSTTERMIADYGIGKTTTESYDRFGDRNNRNKNLAFSYLDNKTGTPLDMTAKEMSDHYGVEITPADLVEFMDRFPGGAAEAFKEAHSDVAEAASNKFRELTGLDLTRDLAKKVIDKSFEKLSDAEKKMAEADFENEQHLTNEYYKNLSEPGQKESETPVATEQSGKAPEEVQPAEPAATEPIKPEEPTKKPISEQWRRAAETIRGLKLMKQDVLQSNIFGLPAAIYDAALETIATAIEQGAKLADAIAAGIDYIKKNHGENFDQTGFEQTINDSIAGEPPVEKIPAGDRAEAKANNERSEKGLPNWAEPQQKIKDPIGTYTMSSRDMVGQYLSGETIQASRGEESLAPQEYHDMMSLNLAGQDAENMITQSKAAWGDEILVSGPRILDYANQFLKSTDTLYKKIVLLNGLIREINNEKFATRDFSKRQRLDRLLREVDITYQRDIREASKALNAGRLMNLERFITGGDNGGSPETLILSSDKVSARDELLKKIREGEVSDEEASKPIEKEEATAQKDIESKLKESKESIDTEKEAKKKMKKKPAKTFKDQAEKIARDKTGNKDAAKARKDYIQELKDRFNNLNC